mmetsp:Transcript_32954/g.98137  ORF Transcript_32954/g.98137 Transcript_32954/m.98137 type:complete len:251 (-) Transcript_32954:480-1232(-)
MTPLEDAAHCQHAVGMKNAGTDVCQACYLASVCGGPTMLQPMANPATLRPKVQQLQSAHSVVQQAQGAHARCTAGTAAGIPALAQPRTRLHFHMGKRISVRSARAAPRARRLGCGGCLVVRVTRVTVHEESAARDTRLLLKLLQLLDSRARHRVPDLGGLWQGGIAGRQQIRGDVGAAVRLEQLDDLLAVCPLWVALLARRLCRHDVCQQRLATAQQLRETGLGLCCVLRANAWDLDVREARLVRLRRHR